MIIRKLLLRLRELRAASYGSKLIKSIDPEVATVIRQVRERRLTYLTEAKMAALACLCSQIRENEVPGRILEAGCALGGSSIVMAAAKERDRPMLVYDVFGMIPPPTEDDGKDVLKRYNVIKSGGSGGIRGDKYYGYENELYTKVDNSFSEMGFPTKSNNVSLIKGLVRDTLQIDGPVALAHVDVDWFDPVMICLERIIPKLSPGGAIVLDDYFYWSGCKRAFNEYFSDRGTIEFEFNSKAGSLIITKKTSV